MNNQLKAAAEIILGNKPDGYYLAGFFFSLLAILLSLYMQSRSRDKLSPNTPYRFSFWFLVWDNLKRILAGMICMFLFFRFFNLSIELQVGFGFAIAFGLDKLLQWLMNYTDFFKFLRQNRDVIKK